jgi:hypothetical protein
MSLGGADVQSIYQSEAASGAAERVHIDQSLAAKCTSRLLITTNANHSFRNVCALNNNNNKRERNKNKSGWH